MIAVAVVQQKEWVAPHVLALFPFGTRAHAVGLLLEVKFPQFQMLQVTRPLHGDTVLPGQQIYVADPQATATPKSYPPTSHQGRPSTFACPS